MAQNNPLNSPTTTSDAVDSEYQNSTSSIPYSISSSSTYLAIPAGRMARSSSHESFATDISLLSLSSFTSEMPSRQCTYDKDDDPDSDRDLNLSKYREDMFEKMLEMHASTSLMPKSKSRTPICNKPKSESNRFGQEIEKDSRHAANGISQSEEDLLKKCARDEPRIKGSLYKSFSTSDVLSLSESLFYRAYSCNTAGENSLDSQNVSAASKRETQQGTMKSCVSQSWIPNDYAKASQRRKKHLEYLKRMCTNSTTIEDEWNFLCKEDQAHIEHSQNTLDPGTSQGKSFKSRMNRKCKDPNPNHGDADRKSISEENIGFEPRRSSSDASSSSRHVLMKKFNFSKELGFRIKDDLMRKLSKYKQPTMSITRNDLEREKGRPLTRLERNFIIFHWLQSLDDDSFAHA